MVRLNPFLKVGSFGPDSLQLYGKGQPAKSLPVLGKLLKKKLSTTDY